MAAEIDHNTGVMESAEVGAPFTINVKSKDLPMVIILELEDGSTKRYSLVFAKTAKGLILNKAV